MSDTITKIFEIAHELAAQNMEHSDFLIFLSAERETYQQYNALLARLETAEKALEEARKVIENAALNMAVFGDQPPAFILDWLEAHK